MSRTILLVDDSEDDLFVHQRALLETGHRLKTAPTLAAGLALADECLPDVILLDYNLPDGNGLEFIRRLNEQDTEDAPPVVMLTGSGDEGIAVAAMKAGASDYLIKDVAGGHLKLLPTVIERVLREHADRLAKRETDRQLQLAANVYHHITEGILATQPDGTIVSVNPSLCLMTGYSGAELIGANPRIFQSGRYESVFYQTMWASLSEDGSWQGEIWNRRKNGSLFLARETITAIRNTQGRLLNYMAVLIDITEAKQTDEFIRHQAYHDPLTNLPNRALFMDRLRHKLAYAHRQKNCLAVLFIDLDGFKAVNDDLGHEVGDSVLKEAAVRLKDCVRESDTVARLGGDEFTGIIDDIAGPDDAAQVAKKMLDRIAQPFLLGSHERRISASIGIALYPADRNDAVALLNAADEAMYLAKHSGRAAFAFASKT